MTVNKLIAIYQRLFTALFDNFLFRNPVIRITIGLLLLVAAGGLFWTELRSVELGFASSVDPRSAAAMSIIAIYVLVLPYTFMGGAKDAEKEIDEMIANIPYADGTKPAAPNPEATTIEEKMAARAKRVAKAKAEGKL